MDPDLTDRLRRQDLDALGDLFRLHGGAMTTLARSLLRNPDAADDIVATALLKIHKAAPGYRGGPGGIRSWILSIVANLARDALRRRRFDGGRVEDLDPLATSGLSINPVVQWDEALDQEKLLAELERAIDGLTGEQREAVILRDRLGMSYEEAAGAAGVTVEVLKARLFRARQALKQALRGPREDVT